MQHYARFEAIGAFHMEVIVISLWGGPYSLWISFT